MPSAAGPAVSSASLAAGQGHDERIVAVSRLCATQPVRLEPSRADLQVSLTLGKPHSERLKPTCQDLLFPKCLTDATDGDMAKP